MRELKSIEWLQWTILSNERQCKPMYISWNLQYINQTPENDCNWIINSTAIIEKKVLCEYWTLLNAYHGIFSVMREDSN